MSFRQAAARFSAEVERALTRARRATREARAESAEFRRRTEELSGQAKTGRLRGLRRGQVAPTDPDAQADAVKFRTANGLPVPEHPTADELMARLPGRQPAAPAAENEDFSNAGVLFEIDKEPLARQVEEPLPIDEPEPRRTRSSETEADFSQQRILLDATEETYRPGAIRESVFDLDDPENRR